MINITYPIYKPSQKVIDTHLANWRSWKKDTQRLVRVIIIDDGSPEPVDISPDFPMNLIVARINEDIYWNVGGAQNLAHHLAPKNEWVLSTDIDHIVPEHTAINLSVQSDRHLDKNIAYQLTRKKNGSVYKTGPNTFFMYNQKYLDFNGYDEDLAGNGGFNDEMLKAKIRWAGMHIGKLDDIWVDLDESLSLIGTVTKKGKEINLSKWQTKIGQMRNNTYKQGNSLRFTWKIIKELKCST